jgi:hypothetical protein
LRALNYCLIVRNILFLSSGITEADVTEIDESLKQPQPSAAQKRLQPAEEEEPSPESQQPASKTYSSPAKRGRPNTKTLQEAAGVPDAKLKKEVMISFEFIPGDWGVNF